MAKRELNPFESIIAQWAQEASDGPVMPEFDPEFSASFPNLWMFLAWREVGNLERTPGSLSLTLDGSGWRLSYYDPGSKRRCSVLAPSLTDALKRLDAAVVASDTVWSGGANRNRGFRKRKNP